MKQASTSTRSRSRSRSRSGNPPEDDSRRRETKSEKILFWMLVVYVALLAIAGGPVPSGSVIALFVLSAAALTLMIAFRRAPGGRTLPPLLRVLLAMLVALPALQIIPLPPAWWQALPGGMLRRDVLGLIGQQQSWQPLSLVPVDTLGTVLLAACFVVLVSAMVALRERRFRQVLYALGVIALVNLAIGILQAASGGSPHILVKADHGALLGFFANKNHAGMAIAASLALFVQIVDSIPFLRDRRTLALATATVLALVCVVPTDSRAGLLFTLAVGLWVMLRFINIGRPWIRIAAAAGVAALFGLISLSPVFEQVYRRFGHVDQDLRWRFVEQSEPLARAYGLWGAGGGSFSRLFIVNERLEWVKPTIVNEAHNEYLQTVIEYGVPGVALLLGLFAALLWTGVKGWRAAAPSSAPRRALEVGGVIVLLFIAHSAIDYPLRRPATWALFATGCALIIRNGTFSRTDDRTVLTEGN